MKIFLPIEFWLFASFLTLSPLAAGAEPPANDPFYFNPPDYMVAFALVTLSHEAKTTHELVTLSHEAIGTCDGDEYNVDRWDESDNSLTISYFGSNEKKRKQLHFVKQRASYKGVPVFEYGIDHWPSFQINGDIVFRKPISSSLALNFDLWSYCAWLGYAPGLLKILYDPSQVSAFETWVSGLLKDGLIEAQVDKSKGPIGRYDDIANAGAIDMIPGYERKIIQSIINQPWLIDYSMKPYPRGLPSEILSFPENVIDYDGNPTASSQLVTEKVMKTAFPKLTPENVSITHTKGSSFDVTISAPMTKIWPSQHSYSAYWLQANISIMYWWNGRQSGWSYGYVEVREGWLPKWPQPDSPPQSHYKQFQLSEEGGDKFSNNTVLDYVQSEITKSFVKNFNATVKD